MINKKIIRKSSVVLLLYIVFLSGGALFSHAQSLNYPSWKVVNKDDGIQVFTRQRNNSAIKEIRITCTVKTTMEHMNEFLSNASMYKEWVYKCDSSYQIEVLSPQDFRYYVTFDFPFPFDDRDLMVHSQHWIDSTDGVYHSISKAEKDTVLVSDGFVRINEFESTWDISPRPNGELFIDYKALSNPGGDIPTWLVNLFIAKGPLETMKRFRQSVEEN